VQMRLLIVALALIFSGPTLEASPVGECLSRPALGALSPVFQVLAVEGPSSLVVRPLPYGLAFTMTTAQLRRFKKAPCQL
jgi:hypothetical protein